MHYTADLHSTLQNAGFNTDRLPRYLDHGRIYRIPAPGKKPSDRNGWVIQHSDDVATYGDWGTGERDTWTSGQRTSDYVPPKRTDTIDKARLSAQQQAAERARWIWDTAKPAPDEHPYCRAKGITAEGLRVNKSGVLIVPMLDATAPTAGVVNLQFIQPDGSKRYLKDAKRDACYPLLPGEGAPIFAEGLATAWTVRAATGRPVVVAFDAGNLPKVAAVLAEDGSAVAADNDNREKPGAAFRRKVATYGTGHRKAIETGLPFYLPPVPGYDFNDLGIADTAAVFSREPVSSVPVFDAWSITPADLPSSTKDSYAAVLSRVDGVDAAAALARAAGDRLSVRSPDRLSLMQIRMHLERHLPPHLVNPLTLDSIIARLEWFQNQRKAAALASVAVPMASKRLHAWERVTDLPELTGADFTGVLVVKAPMGAGKTQHIGRPFSEWAQVQIDGAFLAVCHRVSLVSELSHRLSVPSYADVVAEELPFINGLATCLPSTTLPEHAPLIDRAGYVFIDEITQVIRFLSSESHCRTKTATNEQVYERLREIVTGAQCVVVADANIDQRTIEFLESCRPNERFRMIEMAPKAEGIEATYAAGRSAPTQVMGDCLQELAAGGRVWLAVESRARSRALGTLFEAYGYRVLSVDSSNKGSKAQKAFLADIEGQSRLYDVVLASPVISSGVSVEHGDMQHFTLGALIASGVKITPSDAFQMLKRVRYLKRFSLGLMLNTESGAQSPEAILAAMEAAAKVEGDRAKANHFDALVADIDASERNQRADFAAALLWQLDAAGWRLSRSDTDLDDSLADSIKGCTDAAKAAHHRALIDATPIDDDRAHELERMAERTELQNIELEAYRIRRALNVPAVTDEVLAYWDDGRALRRMDRFDAARGVIPAFDDSTASLSRRRFWKACARAYAYLFDGIDAMGDFWLNEFSARVVVDRIMGQRHLLSHLGIVGRQFGEWKTDKRGELKPMKYPTRPIKVVSDVLARMGLKLKSKQVRNVHTQHGIYLSNTAASVYTSDIPEEPKRGRIYRVSDESLAEMQSWTDRRNLARRTKPVEPKPVRVESAVTPLVPRYDDAPPPMDTDMPVFVDPPSMADYAAFEAMNANEPQNEETMYDAQRRLAR